MEKYKHDRLLSTSARWKKYGMSNNEKSFPEDVRTTDIVLVIWVTLLTIFNAIMFFYGN